MTLDIEHTAMGHWTTHFVDGVPGDPSSENRPRQVEHSCYSMVRPTMMPKPKLLLWNKTLGDQLHLSPDVAHWSGNQLIEGMTPFAHCYGGHQFGSWAGQLGDGRAISLGSFQHETSPFEIQLKGAGRTPYSRRGDGRAVLRSSLREFLCSEAMHHLRVPTSRALSLVSTGEQVVRDLMYDGHPEEEPGAIVTRIAESFIRFGSFEIHAARRDETTLKQLVEYTMLTHFSEHEYSKDGICAWLTEVGKQTAHLVCEWMRVGFVHGVLNTDNLSIHSVTIDYGPYGWIEPYDLGWTPNTTDLHSRRYTFGNQPMICMWNFAKLLDAILPAYNLHDQKKRLLTTFQENFKEFHHTMWCNKLGIAKVDEASIPIITELEELLQTTTIDMTIFFRELTLNHQFSIENLEPALYTSLQESSRWSDWIHMWHHQVEGVPNREVMNISNPKYVLRNWMVYEAIQRAEEGDLELSRQLYECLTHPYDEQPKFQNWYSKRPAWAEHKPGCSMLSCSS